MAWLIAAVLALVFAVNEGILEGVVAGSIAFFGISFFRLTRQVKLLQGEMDGLNALSREPQQASDPAPSPLPLQENTARQNGPVRSLHKAGVVSDSSDSPDGLSINYQDISVQLESSAPLPVRVKPDHSARPEVPGSPPSSATEAVSETTPSPLDFMTQWFMEGNLFVRIGLVMLFFGMAFLLKYVAEHSYVSIAVRMTGAAITGLVMLAVGWHLRKRSQIYGLLLQGGGFGLFFLCIYAAFAYFHLLPQWFALSLLGVTSVVAALFAVVQNARALAVMGVTGGFLAPVLVSQSSGQHVALFSYFLLLNLMIFIVAWFKAWRSLNILGFLFTYLIASVWGVLSYQSHHFATTEPFLVAFFLMYSVIGLLFAYHLPFRNSRYVDGTIIFGNAFVAFGLQVFLVDIYEYGLAISALVLAVYYALISYWLHERHDQRLDMLRHAHLALAVLFFTLSLPFFLDDHWTVASWALESSIILWVSLRQKSLPALVFALLLQLGSGVLFLEEEWYHTTGSLFLNRTFYGAIMLAVAGFFSAWHLSCHGRKVLSTILFVWSLLWWAFAFLSQLEKHVSFFHQENYLLMVAIGSVILAWMGSHFLDWRHARAAIPGFIPVLMIISVLSIGQLVHPLAHYGWLIWPVAVILALWLLRQLEDSGQFERLGHFHALLLYVVAGLLHFELLWWLGDLIVGTDNWQVLYWVIVPAGLAAGSLIYSGWPLSSHERVIWAEVVFPLHLYLSLWLILVSLFHSGTLPPLSYLPILNPLDCFSLVVIGLLYTLHQRVNKQLFGVAGKRVAKVALGLALFVWLNGLLIRSVHQFAGIAFDLHQLWNSVLLQVSLSILWTSLGLTTMIVASRFNQRSLWLAGSALVAVVVLKVTAIDLEASGTIERIVSFLVVGGLLVVLGYFAPVPERQRAEEGRENELA